MINVSSMGIVYKVREEVRDEKRDGKAWGENVKKFVMVKRESKT